MKKWKSISKKEVFYKYGRGIEEVIYLMPDGREEKYYLNKEVEGAFVFAITKDNMVVLVKQFRPGPNDFTLEVPVGAVDKGEKPIDTAKRELLEETGYDFGSIESLGEVYRSMYGSAKNHLFLARDCQKVCAQNLDKNEEIEVVLKSVDEFRKYLIKNPYANIIGYRALDYLGLL